jgi:hypothetical protein
LQDLLNISEKTKNSELGDSMPWFHRCAAKKWLGAAAAAAFISCCCPTSRRCAKQTWREILYKCGFNLNMIYT